MQWCCLSLRTTLCTRPPRTLWTLGWAWEVDRLRRAAFTHSTTSKRERERERERKGGRKSRRRNRKTEWTWVGGKTKDDGEDFIVIHIQDRKNEFVWMCVLVLCVCVSVCECLLKKEGEDFPPGEGSCKDCQSERTAKLLLMWRTWWMLLNSIETLHYSDPPQVHKAYRSTTETLRKALIKTLNDWYVSKVCIHRLLQTLQRHAALALHVHKLALFHQE